MWIWLIIIGASFLISVGLASFVAGRAQQRGRSAPIWALSCLAGSSVCAIVGYQIYSLGDSTDDGTQEILIAVTALLAPAPGMALAVVVGKLPAVAAGGRLRGFLLAADRGDAQAGRLGADAVGIHFEPTEGAVVAWPRDQIQSLRCDGELVIVALEGGATRSFRPEGDSRDLRLQRARDFVSHASV